MGSQWTPKNKAIALAWSKRMARKASGLVASLLYVALLLAIMGGTIGAASIVAVSAASPWMKAGFEPWLGGGDVWLAGAAWVALGSWAVFDARRSAGLFANVDPWRPAAAATLVLGSGLFLLMDRMVQLLAPSGAFGWAPKFMPNRDPFIPSPSGSWAAAWDPLREVGEYWIMALRKWPEAVMVMSWGLLSAIPAIALMPLAYAELGVAWAADKLKAIGGGSLRAAAGHYAEELLAEGQQQLAAGEADELRGEAKPTGRDGPAPRL